MDKSIFEKNLNQKVEIINDENFRLVGKIIEIYDNSIAFDTDGKIRYLDFDRIKELRPIWKKSKQLYKEFYGGD